MADFVTIKIKDTVYKLKKSFRGLYLFEEMTGIPVPEMADTTGNMLKMFYCLLQGANKDTFLYSFDDFLDVLDDNENIVEDFNKYMISLSSPIQEQKKVPKKKR